MFILGGPRYLSLLGKFAYQLGIIGTTVLKELISG